LLGLAAFTADRLLPIAPPMTVAGRVAMAVDGLRAGTPVVLCGHDHLAGAWGAGVRKPGQVADSMGTSEAVVTPSEAVVLDDRLRREGVSSGWYVDGQHGCAISGHGAAGGLVDQLLAVLQEDYRWLADVLAEVGPPSAEVIAPYPAGRQAPAPDPVVRYDAAAPVVDRRAAAQGLIDGLSLHARWMAESQTSLLGIDWHDTVAFGGPTRLAGWTARKALASAGPDGRAFLVVPGDATAAAGSALMVAEVVTGQGAPTLQAFRVPVDQDLAKRWDGHFWHRFHKVVTSARD